MTKMNGIDAVLTALDSIKTAADKELETTYWKQRYMEAMIENNRLQRLLLASNFGGLERPALKNLTGRLG